MVQDRDIRVRDPPALKAICVSHGVHLWELPLWAINPRFYFSFSTRVRRRSRAASHCAEIVPR